VLVLVYTKPDGIIDFESFSGKSLLVAVREGSANCFSTFKLKENHQFLERNVCFGLTEVKGTYELKGDTIFFKTNDLRNKDAYYEYAVIKPLKIKMSSFLGEIIKYKNKSDTIGYELL